MAIKHSVSPTPTRKVWGDFFLKKALHGGNFFGQIYAEMFYMGANDQIMQGGRTSFKNVFFSNLNTMNLKIFHSQTHLKINPYESIELFKDLSLRLMVKRFQRSSQVQFPSR